MLKQTYILDKDTFVIKNREEFINTFHNSKITLLLEFKSDNFKNVYSSMSNLFAFGLICQSGDIEVAKCMLQIWSELYNDIFVFNYAFRIACQHGHLHIAKWLYELQPNIDIREYGDYAFNFACYNGYIEIVRWLYELEPNIDISIYNDYTFKDVCKYNRIKVAEWFCEMKPNRYSINVNDNNKISYTINK
jgi:ankyrin repeat protein